METGPKDQCSCEGSMRYSGKGLNAGPGPWWVELLLFLQEGDENKAGEEIGQTMEGLAAIGRFCSLAWGRKQLTVPPSMVRRGQDQ